MESISVSLCVVALNEEKYLPNVLEDFKNQDYPHNLIEIILVDSGSSDNTKKVMEEFAATNKDFLDVRIYDNPKKIQAAGWNVAIKNAKCDVITRIDAHTKVPSDFLTKNISNIEAGESVCGGIRPCLIDNNSSWSAILLRTENSLFGSSINKSRFSTKKQYVKTLFHATYRREVFEKCGVFNEKLLRTEDNEMHYRIRKNGYKICYDPQIVSYQYARNSLRKAIKQKFGNGYWVGLTFFKCPCCLSLYHFIPFGFLCSIILFLVIGILFTWIPMICLASAYALFALANTIISSIHEKWNKYVFLMPFFFLILHISYGIGTFTGFLSFPRIIKSKE